MFGETRAMKTTAAMSLIASVIFSAPALADSGKPKMDYFINNSPANNNPLNKAPLATPKQNTADKIGQGAFGMMSDRTPAVNWFEAFDTSVNILGPSAADAVVLTMPLNQELERVQHWTATANKVSKNYKLLAHNLKNMTIPPDAPLLAEFRDLEADWYLDRAGVYDDLTRPRPPAKTMEELEDGLKHIEDRAKSTAETAKRLHDMDMTLRKTYHVHLSRQTDALSQYVMGTPNANPKK